MTNIVALLLVGISLLMGVEVPEVPKVEMITMEQGQAKTGIPIRGYYEKGTLYLVKNDENQVELALTIGHELVHYVQDTQGKLSLFSERTPASCEQWYANEVEALNIEDQMRKTMGMEPTDRFMYVIMRASCLGGS